MDRRFTQVFWLDAGVTGGVGLMLVAAGGILESLLGLPTALIRGVGLSFVLFAGFVTYVALQQPLRVNHARFAIGCNALWVLVSVLFLLLSDLEPTLLGTAFILFQALVVAGFAGLQVFGLERRPSMSSPVRSP